MKNNLWILLVCSTSMLPAQKTLVLDSVLQQAEAHYPLKRQELLIDQQRDFSLAALNKGFLPQLIINGQASYQSDVTSVPVVLPGIPIETLDKDQYRITADMIQVLYDGGNIAAQKSIQRAGAEVEQARMKVELQKMRELVRKYYLGVLMLDEQIEQLEITDKDIESGIRRMESAVKNGVAFRSQLSVLQAEALKNKQRMTELRAGRSSLLEVLSLYTGSPIGSGDLLVRPMVAAPAPGLTLKMEIQRPELNMFSAQQNLADQQRKWIGSKSLPKLSLFGQGGYGRPGLNMLENDFKLYYIAGARLNWNVGAFYTLQAERSNNRIAKMTTDVNRDQYLRTAEITVTQCRNDIDKYELMLKDDDAILSIREEIMNATKAQLDNGVITSSDYLREVNAYDQARQSKLLHELQLLQARLDLNDYLANNP
ncbi:MAG: hypothetical protein RLZZ630_897 [Bacteroidota bacterium]|jgi:outer membrane protein TolC